MLAEAALEIKLFSGLPEGSETSWFFRWNGFYRRRMSSTEIMSRIEAAKAAVLAQTELLHREFGRAASHWKADGTRVTDADIAISENIVRQLSGQFPRGRLFQRRAFHRERTDPGDPALRLGARPDRRHQ